MKYYIVTGSSKGLGKAVVARLTAEGGTVFCISRSGTQLQSLAGAQERFHDIRLDLAKIDGLEPAMEGIFAMIDPQQAEGVYLINNAGLIDPVSAVEHHTTAEVELHMTVNLIAPMRLTALFIRLSKQFQCPKVVANVSSGAALKPYRGWGLYCAAKAGLNMFSQVAGLEQSVRSESGSSAVKVYAVAPGKVDTGMQATLRSHSAEEFPDREAFVRFKESGELSSPERAAEQLIRTLDSDSVAHGDVIDVRSFAK